MTKIVIVAITLIWIDGLQFWEQTMVSCISFTPIFNTNSWQEDES